MAAISWPERRRVPSRIPAVRVAGKRLSYKQIELQNWDRGVAFFAGKPKDGKTVSAVCPAGSSIAKRSQAVRANTRWPKRDREEQPTPSGRPSALPFHEREPPRQAPPTVRKGPPCLFQQVSGQRQSLARNGPARKPKPDG